METPGSSPGVGATQSADAALPLGRPGRRTWFSRLGEYAGFAPALVLFGVFFLVPLGLIVCYSFWKTVDYNVVHAWTVDNYRYFFSVPTYVSTFWATVWVSFAATALTLVIAFPFAYWLARYVPKRYQKVLLVLVILPFWTSYLLRVYSWLTILGPQGAINRFLEWTGATSKPVSFFLYDRPAVILVLVYLYFPFAALTLYASLERFDWNQFRAAMDLGATPGTAVWRILLPQIRPGITTAVIFVFIPILGEYLTPQLVGGAKGVMIGNLIVNFFQGAQYTRGAAAALLIAGLIVILLAVFRRSLEVEDPYGT
jgi:ABC-type spermidine/putrescine transport system permease subunit I